MRVLKEIVVVYLIPFIPYVELSELLETLDFQPSCIKAIKWREHDRRIVCTIFPNCYILQQYTIDGQLHREDGPALIRSWGAAEWYANGKLLKW